VATEKRQIKELLDEIESLSGWRVRRADGRRSPHSTIYPPDGQMIITIPTSPSDYRWRKNLRSQLRQAGWTGTLLD
jgi:hypothetical protein